MRCKLYVIVSLMAASVVLSMSCSSSDSSRKTVANSPLQSESDSLAYIIGMNVARELQKMDSLINYDVVCRAILDHAEGESLMSDEEARTQYLRYLLFVEPERRRSIEERFLADLVVADRSFTRTKSGLTYNIAVIGDEKVQPKAPEDWVTISYYIKRVGDEILYPQPKLTSKPTTVVDRVEESMALSDLPLGVVEALKLIGKGGNIRAWIPSKLGYGETGDAKRGVEPVETLYFDIMLTDVDPKGTQKRKSENF